eukprot:gene13577-19452_t
MAGPAKKVRLLVKMVSMAKTGFFYVTAVMGCVASSKSIQVMFGPI